MSSSGESSADLQRDAEAERAELVSTLDQLRENLKPSNMIDEVMGTAHVSTAEISEKVWQTARANPIPAIFIGLGAAMLLGVGNKVRGKKASAGRVAEDPEVASVDSPHRVDPADIDGQTRVAMNRTGAGNRGEGRIAAELQAVNERAAASASQIARSARSLRREAFRTTDRSPYARKGFDFVSGTPAMRQPSRTTNQITGSLMRLIDDQPLVLAAVGVAIGAALGAAIPGTETEGRLMGDASVSLKSRAQDLAQSEIAHLKATASTTLDQLKQNAADHGVSTDNLAGLVQDTGATVRGAVQDVTDHAANTAGLKA